MIVPMVKYDFVLYRERYGDFLDKLRELGLVDITTTGWEPSEDDLSLLSLVEQHRQAAQRFAALRADKHFMPGQPYATGHEAFERYTEAVRGIETVQGQIARARKEADELRVWGDFNPDALAALAAEGVELRYFSAYDKDFDDQLSLWEEQYTVERIGSENGLTYFVVIVSPGTEVLINAQELKAPAMNYSQKEEEIARLEKELGEWNGQLARAAASADAITEEGAQLQEKLQLRQVHDSGRAEADGSLLILEGWASRETAEKVDAMLEAYPDLIYLKSNPTPDDDAPVLLKNNRFAKLFEVIGDFYSLPKYGSTDLTPYFAPFYMIFFGFCLGEGGYGLILLLAGIFMMAKGKGNVRQMGKLTIWCAASTMFFGLATGSFFGIQLAGLGMFARWREYFLTPENLFSLAIGLGLVQILFGMTIKAVGLAVRFGIRYALPTIGWMTVLVSTLATMIGSEAFTMKSPAYLILLCAGLFMMLFLNSPGKNPLVNFGAGLWNTYNDVSGLIGDVLSYIRLFAIGLSGGILAQVFNALAFGLSPEIPVLREICILLILLVGHGINLFMSTLSSFVHPMRLTFVEFYKNAGFEAGQRVFTPFKKQGKQE